MNQASSAASLRLSSDPSTRMVWRLPAILPRKAIVQRASTTLGSSMTPPSKCGPLEIESVSNRLPYGQLLLVSIIFLYSVARLGISMNRGTFNYLISGKRYAIEFSTHSLWGNLNDLFCFRIPTSTYKRVDQSKTGVFLQIYPTRPRVRSALAHRDWRMIPSPRNNLKTTSDQDKYILILMFKVTGDCDYPMR